MFDFSQAIDRRGTWCTQWDYVEDRFGHKDLLPFTISDMDFATAPCVLDALQQRVAHGVFGYSRWQNDAFPAAIAHWYRCRFDTGIDLDQLVYAPSVIYAVAQLIRLWSMPGDAVVMHAPAYDAFYKVIVGNQRTALTSPLQYRDGEWHADMDQLETLLARREAKVLLLCSPHNPTGKVWRDDELATMARLCEQYDVKVISDEIHMDLAWGGQQHRPWSAFGRSPWALFTSASKSFNLPALGAAYGLISDRGARDTYLTLLKHRDGLSSPSVLGLSAHVAAYRDGAPWLDALRDYLTGNLRFVQDRLAAELPELQWRTPQATYLAWIDLNPLDIDDAALQRILIDRYKVAIMPGETYGAPGRGFLRLNAGCPRAKLADGVERMIAAIRQASGR
ncbi:pyridoxal phosphate-dependent aminotransferase [Jeongeupia wiesaeckerbachi]|uniref:MalY/PatB family protein n=1 Tax=Jeongeupia wiesaeckerbachi TaxID=3051218 RepID=UPI003D807651